MVYNKMQKGSIMKKILLLSLIIIFAGGSAFARCGKLFGRCERGPVTTPVQEQEMTLGLVQREVKIGCSQADVAEALGSPNIITKDADGKDTWIYDKVARITNYNSSGFGIGAGSAGGGLAGSGAVGGVLGVSYGKNTANVQSTQKTLTVVIKFDTNFKVESFTYHMSKF